MGSETESERMDRWPDIDWVQAQLNGWSYCFAIESDGTFCGRAERWPFHGDEDSHEFETLASFLSNKRADSRWIDDKLRKKCQRQESELEALRARVERLYNGYDKRGENMLREYRRAEAAEERAEKAEVKNLRLTRRLEGVKNVAAILRENPRIPSMEAAEMILQPIRLPDSVVDAAALSPPTE